MYHSIASHDLTISLHAITNAMK
ncbi:unnamed protein product [Tuber melanosporum]|uniref:(Perigord truffle) hypothetical protein n=1 Tax=Tuber melanosporum (strain Mel28) TaxID=656061 RepID=D5GH02_TUBMM|nr:unnamed protein product [Tuber melanosporum]